MLDGHPSFLAPVSRSEKIDQPHNFPGEVGFALTAFNPAHPHFPQHPSTSQNIAMNSKLYTELKTLFSQTGIAVTSSYGFGEGGWREDGYVVSCKRDRETEAEKIVLNLARKYGQGAVYKYTLKSDTVLVRHTIPAFESFDDTRVEVDMCAVEPPEDWTGNLDWPKNIWHPTLFYETGCIS